MDIKQIARELEADADVVMPASEIPPTWMNEISGMPDFSEGVEFFAKHDDKFYGRRVEAGTEWGRDLQ